MLDIVIKKNPGLITLKGNAQNLSGGVPDDQLDLSPALQTDMHYISEREKKLEDLQKH